MAVMKRVFYLLVWASTYCLISQNVFPIDWKFSARFGGQAHEATTAIATDQNGYIYIAGETSSLDFPTSNALDSSFNGLIDIFICKLTAEGDSVLFSTYIGGNAGDFVRAIALDSLGSIWITGTTQSSDFPTVSAFQPMLSGFNDAFLLKLSNDGNSILASTFFGGTSYDEGFDLAIDSVQNVWVAGATQGGIVTLNAIDGSHNGLADIFLAQFDSQLNNLIFSTYWGGNLEDENPSIAITNGRVFISGDTRSSNFPTIGIGSESFKGWYDGFLLTFDQISHNVLFSSCVGGTSEDRLRGMSLDSDGNVWLAGLTASTDFPLVDPMDSVLEGEGLHSDGILVMYANGTSLTFSTLLGGTGDQFASDIVCIDPTEIFLALHTYSSVDSSFPLVTPIDIDFNGGSDLFLFSLDYNTKSITFSSYLGGSDAEGGWENIHVSLAPNGDILIGSLTRSSDFPVVASPLSGIGGDYDGTITSLNGCCDGIRGDIDGDGTDANILDLTYMVDRIFRGGPVPGCPNEADVNSDGTAANILDLTFLVDRIFRGGPVPGACI